MQQTSTQELTIITKVYDFILWALPHISRFPRDRRFVLGERMETCLFDLLDFLLEAKYARAKKACLREANVRLQRLRFQWRLCHDFNIIKTKSYEYACRCLDDIGKELGGWLKSEESP